jgi:hypothetical protein
MFFLKNYLTITVIGPKFLGACVVTHVVPAKGRAWSKAPAGRVPSLNLVESKGGTAALRCVCPLFHWAAWVRGGNHWGGGHRLGAHPGRHRLRHLPRQVPIRRLPPLQGRDPRGRRHHGQ